MLPSIAFPYHDPDLQMLPRLKAILPDLKAHFRRAYICPPLDTQRHSAVMEWLNHDDFFTIFPLKQVLQIGEHFAYLYRCAAQTADPDEILHLAYVDRLAFGLLGPFREQFLNDIDSITVQQTPLIFQRSESAWQSHPQNYFEIESFVTTIGKILFGRPLDYAWCHLVVQACQLKAILPMVKRPDLSMVAEMILWMQPNISTKEVDWLAWEDPFILSRVPEELKRERENSAEETQRRLSYAIPMVQALVEFALKSKSQQP